MTQFGDAGIDERNGHVAVDRVEALTLLDQAEAAARPARRAPHAPPRAFNLGDRIFGVLTGGAAALILATLILLLAVLAYNSRLTVQHIGFSFLTSSTWDTIHNVYGAAPAVLGTVYSSLLALALSAAVALLVAIFLAEMAPHWLRGPLGFLVELLAAVPSVVYGLWALYVLVPLVRNLETPLVAHFGNFPLFSGPPLGYGMLAAGLVLAIMILPTIAAIGRDVMLAVPNSQREAMLALGATRWETTWKVVIPFARSGIIGGVILGLGRAVGETMAVQMVIGNNTQLISPSIVALGTTMPAALVNQFSEATGGMFLSALFEIALILMFVAILLNALARLLVWSVTRKFQI